MVVKRDVYLKSLIAGRHNGLIKIITGIRRCGKSYLLFKLFYDYLKENGVDDKHIIKIDLEDYRNKDLRNPDTLLSHIDSKINDSDMHYILLDEVQHVPDFEEVLNSYLKIENTDVYVTGSNSKFLSSDIITEFRGRGDQIHIHPLSFAEYYSAIGGDKTEAWENFSFYGGLPHITLLDSPQKKAKYLANLYQTVYKKDLIERNNIRKAAEFDELAKIISSSIGSPCNPTKLANTFKSAAKTDLNRETIDSYLNYMQDAFLLEKALRYDVKGKRYINSLSKYYFTDLGLRNVILDFRQQEQTHIMENVIYNELRIRGFSVDVGVVDTRKANANGEIRRKQLEVDFVANLGSRRYYIQSAMAIPNNEKREQESASLNNIPDNFRKIIIVKEPSIHWHTEDGILILSLFDFLLNPDSIDW